MSHVSPITAYDSAVDADFDPVIAWKANIVAAPEPALLSRILLKATAPEAEVFSLRYDVQSGKNSPNGGLALIEISFTAQPARARSLAAKWGKIVDVQQVSLQSLALPAASL